MTRVPNRSAGLLACAAWLLLSLRAHAECLPQDLTVVLNTGWDQSTGGVPIAVGSTDDDWDVTVDASAGPVPRDADVIASHPAWLTFPDSRWIAADATGPNGTYVYEMCWCMDDAFANPELTFQIRADDRADVRLNGTLVASLPDGTFNDTVVPTTVVSNRALFQSGQNCLEVTVENKYGVVTGFNLVGTVTADDGLCCGCDPQDIEDLAATGIDDATNTPIPSGSDDDEWTATASASGGVLPRPAEVIDTFVGWNVIPGTKWISADENGPNGLYVYEKCWCMDEGFQNPQLSLQLLADDRADVFLNGTLLGSTPPTNAFLFPATSLSTSDPSLFRAGVNCVTIEVQNVSSVVTGLNVAMTITADQAECCDCVEVPADAAGWWPLNEASGPTASDVLNGHDGTWSELSGSPPAPYSQPGKVQLSLTLDGGDDYVLVPDDPGLDFGPGEDLSIDAWVKTGSPLRQVIVHKKGPTLTSPGYSFVAGGPLMFFIADGTTLALCVGSANVDDDFWHFVTVTLDRDLTNGIRLYVDGVIDQECDPTSVTGSLANAEPMYFGGEPPQPPTSQQWWKGQLDEIEIFRRALTTSEVESLYGADHVGKCPPGACEDSIGVPVCEGECPQGFTCVGGTPPAEACTCVPETTTCGGPGPTCNGPCPDPDQVCVDVAGNCECRLPELCESAEAFPECDGICPDSDWTCESNGQRCHCVPPTTPCELSPFPGCGGSCPILGEACEPDLETLTCECSGDHGTPPCEGFVTFPECNGLCPPGLICHNNGQRCHCVTEPHCEDAVDYPTCNGPCPAGLTCEPVPGGPFCDCVEVATPCGEAPHPACDGECPANESCRYVAATNDCDCVVDPPDCGDALYPGCEGACPVNEVCRQTPNQGCDCIPCLIVHPAPVGPVIVWGSGGKIQWTPVTCALTYNLYRFTGPGLFDSNGDGLADDYGDCFQDDIIGTETVDAEDPPSGHGHWYLINAENFVGQSSLGTTSGGQERQATIACP